MENGIEKFLSKLNSEPSAVDKLLTVQEMAERLRVPVSWIYNYSRQKGPGSIPVVRVGKYCRFVEADVLQWLAKKQTQSEAA